MAATRRFLDRCASLGRLQYTRQRFPRRVEVPLATMPKNPIFEIFLLKPRFFEMGSDVKLMLGKAKITAPAGTGYAEIWTPAPLALFCHHLHIPAYCGPTIGRRPPGRRGLPRRVR